MSPFGVMVITVTPSAARRFEHGHVARFRVEPAIDAGLAGEPVDAVFVEHRGVEVGVGFGLGQAGERHLVVLLGSTRAIAFWPPGLPTAHREDR